MASLLHLVSLFIGLGALAIGMGAVVFPEKASSGFGIPATGKALPYVQATGARDIFIGGVFVYLYARSDYAATSLICFLTAVVSSVDFFLTRKNGSRFFSYFHLGGTLALIIYGAFLVFFN